jgi:hypothetical protein
LKFPESVVTIYSFFSLPSSLEVAAGMERPVLTWTIDSQSFFADNCSVVDLQYPEFVQERNQSE